MRILVTGGTGLVGNNVVRQLLARGDQVRVLIRGSKDDPALRGLGLEFAQGDIRDPNAIRNALTGIDGVIHAAGDVHIGWHHFERQYSINVEGTRNIARAARQAGARLVHVSTVNALGLGRGSEPANEITPLGNEVRCGYVLSKQAAEKEVLKEVSEGLSAIIVSPGFMLGPWDWKPSSGRMLLNVHQRFTPFAPRGGCSVCDVRDVAEAMIRGLLQGESGRNYILAGENLRYVDLWRQICDCTGGSPPWMRAGPLMTVIAGKYGDVKARLTGVESDVNSATVAMSNQYHYYCSARAATELGYRIRPLNETIRDAWQWLREVWIEPNGR